LQKRSGVVLLFASVQEYKQLRILTNNETIL